MISEQERAAAIRALLRSPGIGRRRITKAAMARYELALTHRSFAGERGGGPGFDTDFERLEFLGDRVLNLVVAEFLFKHFDEPEGVLTARMEWTKNRNLALVVNEAIPAFPALIRVGKRQGITPGILSGSFEAFIGALYLDAGLAPVRRMIEWFFADSIRKFATDTNYKKQLQESLQARDLPLPVYEIESCDGKSHAPSFTYLVRSGATVLGRGGGRSKSEATQQAARAALETMRP